MSDWDVVTTEPPKTAEDQWSVVNSSGPTLPPEVDTSKSKLESFQYGVGDPIVGAGQLLAHLSPGAWDFGDKVVSGINMAVRDAARATGLPDPGLPTNLSTRPNDLANQIADGGDLTSQVDALTQKREGQYQAGMDAAGRGGGGIDPYRVAGNIASPVNYVPLGALNRIGQGASMVRRLASSGAVGAVIAALNPVTSGDYWSNKTVQAAIGLGTGVLAPVLTDGVIRGGSAIVAPLWKYAASIMGAKGDQAPIMTAAQKEVLRRLGQAEDAGGPTAQDILDLSRGAPTKDLTLMDAKASPVNALAGRTLRQGGAGGERIKNFLRERVQEQGPGLNADVSANVASKTAHEAVEALSTARANAAAPLYEKAYEANPAIASKTIDRILETPAGAQALKQARIKMQNDQAMMGQADPEAAAQMREAGQDVPVGGVASGLNLRTLDYVKRAFDDMIGASKLAGERDNARILTGLKQSFVGELDKADKSGLYPKARAAYSGPSQSIDAVDFGRDALTKATTAEENAAGFAKLSPNDKEFARIGLAQALRNQIDSTRIGSNAAEKIVGNRSLMNKMRPFFDTQGDFDKFIKPVSAEDTMFKTAREIAGGSQTAERISEDLSHEAKAYTSAARAGLEFSSGNIMGGTAHMVRSIGDFMRKPSPELSDEIAKVLTAPLNQPGSHGMAVLREFAAQSPVTRNYLAKASQRAAPQSVVPSVNALAGMTGQREGQPDYLRRAITPGGQ